MLAILSKQEINKFENDVPKFSYQEKEYYFKIPKSLLENIQYKDNKVFMILIYGYFRATNKFYMPDLTDDNLLSTLSNIYPVLSKKSINFIGL